MASSWVPSPPQYTPHTTQTVAPSADVSLRNYTRWRSVLENLIVKYLSQSQDVLFAGHTRTAISTILKKDKADSLKSFTVIEEVLRELSQGE